MAILTKKYIFLIATIFLLTSLANAEKKDYSKYQWPEFSEWLDWKMKTTLSPEQKKVLEYLKETSSIFSTAFSTSTVQPNCRYGYSDPREAIKIVDRSIEEYKKLPWPLECKRYRYLDLESMYHIIKYHKLRIKYGDGTKVFESEYRKLQLKQYEKNLEGMRFSAPFECMKKVGLFDNMEEEMIKLGILDRKELEKKYGFFKIYNKGSVIKCLACDGIMKRVRILYEGDANYENAMKKQFGDFLFGGQKFMGCPEFGYICNKCPEWYEEYPGPTADTILMRNWGWGWHKLVNKKKNTN